MERRQMLKCLIAGSASAALSAPLFAQPPQQGPPPRIANANTGGAARPSADVIVTNPQELEDALREWEQKTSVIKRLRGTHMRYEYDEVFAVEKRAVGEFWHEAPDKGRIDFKSATLPPPPEGQQRPVNPHKKNSSGQSYTIEAEQPQTWVCDGKSIMQIDHTPKTYGLAEIPPRMQGENIMDGPLPFLFGMKADKVKGRYKLSLGSQHNKPGSDGRVKYHIIALPLLQSDARNWQRAEIILDAKYCLPSAIKLIDPAGSKETVYVFPLSEMKANEKFWINNPFKLSLFGYKLVEKREAPAQQQQGLGRSVLPASRSRQK